jgi:hypothetical protein
MFPAPLCLKVVAEWRSAEVNWNAPVNNSDAIYHSIGFNLNGDVYRSGLYFATKNVSNISEI